MPIHCSDPAGTCKDIKYDARPNGDGTAIDDVRMSGLNLKAALNDHTFADVDDNPVVLGEAIRGDQYL